MIHGYCQKAAAATELISLKLSFEIPNKQGFLDPSDRQGSSCVSVKTWVSARFPLHPLQLSRNIYDVAIKYDKKKKKRRQQLCSRHIYYCASHKATLKNVLQSLRSYRAKDSIDITECVPLFQRGWVHGATWSRVAVVSQYLCGWGS